MAEQAERIKKNDWSQEEIANKNGDLPFRTLKEAWDWHLRLGDTPAIRIKLTPEAVDDIKDFYRSELSNQRHHRKKVPDGHSLARKMRGKPPLDPEPAIKEVAVLRTHPVWHQILVAMASWANEQGILNTGGGEQTRAWVPLRREVIESVFDLSIGTKGIRYLRSFLLHMIQEFSWIGEEWQFDDEMTVLRRQVGWEEFQPGSFFKKNLGIDLQQLRNIKNRHDLRFRKNGRELCYRPCDVAEFLPTDFTYCVLTSVFNDLPRYAMLPATHANSTAKQSVAPKK